MKALLLIALIGAVVFVSGCATSGKVVGDATIVGSNVGDKAPDFTFKTTSDNVVKLSDFVDSKKPFVFYFGATWCASCWADLGVAKNVYLEFQDKIGFLYVSLDLGEDEELIRNYKSKKGYPWDLAPGNQQILKDYNAVTTTTKYAINKDGVIIYKGYGVFEEKDWRNLFLALLEN